MEAIGRIKPVIPQEIKEPTMKKIDADYFKDWNYKKHAKFCTAIYLGLYAFDMTVSYFIIRKLFGKTASR